MTNTTAPKLISTGTYGRDFEIEVDGKTYGYHVRNSGAVTNLFVKRDDARGGLKFGSAQHTKVLAAINAASEG